MSDLQKLIDAFDAAYIDLRHQIDAMFPIGCVVRHGNNWCIVADRDPEGCNDNIPLLFENGNVWWKSVLEIRRSEDESRWPRWITERLNGEK